MNNESSLKSFELEVFLDNLDFDLPLDSSHIRIKDGILHGITDGEWAKIEKVEAIIESDELGFITHMDITKLILNHSNFKFLKEDFEDTLLVHYRNTVELEKEPDYMSLAKKKIEDDLCG